MTTQPASAPKTKLIASHRKRLTHKAAEAAKAGLKPYQITDTDIPGFLLRVEPTGRKTWKLRYTKPDGTRSVRTLGRMPIDTAGMAEEKAKAILRGEDPDVKLEPEPAPDAPMTLARFLEDHYRTYLEAHHRRPAATESYITDFDLAERPLAEIRIADVETWRTGRLKAGRKPTSINRQVNALKAALKRAVDWELLESNPLARLKPLKVDRAPLVRYLSPDEERALLAALAARDERMRTERHSANQWRRERGYEPLPEIGTYADNLTPLVTLALNTGLRRGELWNLTWGDVDLKRKMLTVHGGGAKSKQTRHVPLNAKAVSVLKAHRGEVRPLPSVPVFGRHEFKKAFAGVLKAAKIESFRFHDTRHHFASKLVMAGVPLNTVRELLGHADLKMTVRYAHLAPDNLRDAVELLGV